MNDPKSRFIEAAVRPLADNAEQQAAARSLLEISVVESGVGCEEATVRWDAVDLDKRRFGWKKSLYVFLCIVSLVMVTDLVRKLLNYEQATSSIGSTEYVDFFHWGSKISEEEVARDLTPDQTRLLFGDLSKTSYPDRMKSLWESEPDNPAYFSAYADACLRDYKKLPPDFLTTARRLDPNNAWFTYLAAGERSKGALKMRKQSDADRKANAPREWDVLDNVALNESLALLREARSQSKCDGYSAQLDREQIKLLSTGTPKEIVFTAVFFVGNHYSLYKLGSLSAAINAKLWLCGEAGDTKYFNELLDDAEDFIRKIDKSEVESLPGEMVNMNVTFGLVANAFPAARKLGLSDIVAELRPVFETINQRHADYLLMKRESNADLMWDHGGELAHAVNVSNTRGIKNPPQLTMEELEPGRLMDHETVAWTGCYFAWAILVVSIGLAAAFRFRCPVLIRRLALRFEMLIPQRDWIRILGFGVVLPVFYFLAITRLTPLGGRGLSMLGCNVVTFYFDDPPLGFVQWIGLGLLILFSSGAALLVCVRKRCGALGMVSGKSLLLVVPIFCAAAFIPVSGWAVWDYSALVAMTAWILGGVVILWLVMIISSAVFSNYKKQIFYGTVARMLTVPCAFAALLVISSTPIFKAIAFHWSSKDTLVRMDKHLPTGTEYEHRVALQYRKETREVMGDLLK